jgi:hypothetical protein
MFMACSWLLHWMDRQIVCLVRLQLCLLHRRIDIVKNKKKSVRNTIWNRCGRCKDTSSSHLPP